MTGKRSRAKVRRRTPHEDGDQEEPRPQDPIAEAVEKIGVELLKSKLDARDKLQADFFRGAAILLVLMGAGLKFAVEDAVLERSPSWALPLAGLVLSVLAVIAVLLGEGARRQVEGELAAILQQLDPRADFGGHQPSKRLTYTLAAFLTLAVLFVGTYALLLAVAA